MKLNIFKRLSDLEKQTQETNIKLEKIYHLLISSMIIQNIHPVLLQEKSLDMKSIYNYMVKMVTNDKKDNQ